MGLAFHVTRHRFLLLSFSLSILLLLHLLLSPSPTTTTPPTVGPASLLSCLRFSSVGPTPSSNCGSHHQFKILSRSQSLSLLQNSTVLFAGDSQSRLLLLSLLRLLLHPSSSAFSAASSSLFRRHSDFHTLIPSPHSISLHFLWSPFESNISSSLQTLIQPNQEPPHLIIAGSGLWHMLHVTNATDYANNLRAIRRIATKIKSRMFWVGLPVLVEGLLNTEEKRRRMKEKVVEEYNEEVERSGILRVFQLVDVGWWSRECGVRCTEDGMHYDGVVYDAAMQVILNAVKIGAEKQS